MRVVGDGRSIPEISATPRDAMSGFLRRDLDLVAISSAPGTLDLDAHLALACVPMHTNSYTARSKSPLSVLLG